MPIIHNKELSRFIKDAYLPEDLQNIRNLLMRHGTFSFPVLPNGLFPAASFKTSNLYTGYGNVWVRDNIYIAYAHYLNGDTKTALKTVKTLADYFTKNKWRFEKIISGELDCNEPMNRPHIRLNGNDLSEIPQKWAHAENDALGYFIWFLCKIHNEQNIVMTAEECNLLPLFALYFKAIRYWEDEDSGHWEEARKVEASSIGVVVGGLTELRALLGRKELFFPGCVSESISGKFLEDLIAKGQKSLEAILPAECIQSDPRKNRCFDAALLFLIFPMNVVSEDMADKILNGVMSHLQREYGICRYLNDSFWAADYKDKLERKELTIDFSDDIAKRDNLFKNSEEAQWCIFDPIISIIYGLKYEKYRRESDRKLQTYYFNRSLGQLTEEGSAFEALKCPELYYPKKGKFIPNDAVPLLWTQANLWMAFKSIN